MVMDSKAKDKRGTKADAGAGPKAEAMIARLLVRAMWAQDYTTANPDSTPEQRKAAWKEGRAAAVEANLKSCRKHIAFMKRAGVTMTLSTLPASEAEADDSDVPEA
jgi:hypothetical protein